MFGKLTLDAIPYHEPIIMITLAIVALGVSWLYQRFLSDDEPPSQV